MWNNNTLEDELQSNSLDYGIAVNSDRSIPDSRSGLKPVGKRIIYDAFMLGASSNKPHMKSARLVGDTMGRFHPHGDSSIYGAMIRLSQSWVMRYPLIDIHGSNGNILGDGAASMRYTEARLSKLAEDGLLKNIKKGVVDTVLAYSDTEDEPVTFPAIFPNLLCNPNEGIGWAMGCAWAPHNLGEVATAINQVLNGEEPMLPGPDFPTGGVVINKNDIPNIMRTGHGSVKIRGKYRIEKDKIIFYEIPYGTRVESLLEEISAACEAGKISNIKKIANETDKKNGLRLSIYVDKGINPETVVPQLFAKTRLQDSFSYNQVALVGKTPTELNLKDAINIYINHNIDCITREYKYDLDKAESRLEIVNGLLKALLSIDEIIKLIKASESAATAKEELIKRYSFSENQAKAILDMKLARLAHLESVELNNEKADLENKINDLKDILSSRERQNDILKERLDEIVKKYGDARRTELTHIEIKKEEKEIATVVPEDVVVVTTEGGVVKRVPISSFRVQKRNTKGVKSLDNNIMSTIKTNTVDTLMLFTDTGRVYKTIVDNVPSGTNTSGGVHVSELVKMEKNEKVIAVSSLHRKSTPEFIIFITKNGMIKKSYLSEYTKTARGGGASALRLKEGDSVVNVIFQDKEDIIMISKKGMSIRFKTDTITPVGKAAMGVIGMKLSEGDAVLTALPIHKESDSVAVFSVKGLGKKTALSEFTIQGRGGKGIILYNEELAGAAMISDEDNILIIGNKSSVCISAKDIPLVGRTSLGNIMIKNSNIKVISKI